MSPASAGHIFWRRRAENHRNTHDPLVPKPISGELDLCELPDKESRAAIWADHPFACFSLCINDIR